jgi:glyoxylate utilization-related uncharacterized protein
LIGRRWILGHIIDPAEGVRSSKDVEIKWGIHPAGEKRTEWTADDQRTTLVFHVSGEFRIDLTEGSFTLERQGDYLVWGPGIDHSWEARSRPPVSADGCSRHDQTARPPPQSITR